jgi:hypothetical protein
MNNNPLLYINGDDDNDDPLRPFEWNTDVGNYPSPWDAVSEAREEGLTFTQYAERYAAHWPFGPSEPPPNDLVAGMVREMERAAAELDAEI